MASFLNIFRLKLYVPFLSPYTCCPPQPFRPPSLNDPVNIMQSVKIVSPTPRGAKGFRPLEYWSLSMAVHMSQQLRSPVFIVSTVPRWTDMLPAGTAK
jgi:hypothetical protein